MQRRRVIGNYANGEIHTFEQEWGEKVTVTAENYEQLWSEKTYTYQIAEDVFCIPYGGGEDLEIVHPFSKPCVTAIDGEGNNAFIAISHTAGDTVTVSAVDEFNGYVILRK